MSLRQWLTTGKLKTTAPTVPGLPDPGDCTEPREAAAFQAANDAVETIVTSTTDSLLSTPRKRKRVNITTWTKNKGLKLADSLWKTVLQGQQGALCPILVLKCQNQQ